MSHDLTALYERLSHDDELVAERTGRLQNGTGTV